jgi:hypothetical protein
MALRLFYFLLLVIMTSSLVQARSTKNIVRDLEVAEIHLNPVTLSYNIYFSNQSLIAQVGSKNTVLLKCFRSSLQKKEIVAVTLNGNSVLSCRRK